MDSRFLNDIFSNGSVEEQFAWGGEPWAVGTIIEVVDRNKPHQEGDMRTDLYVVIKVVRNGEEAYFKKNGFYVSWDGAHWDGQWVEVKPATRVVTAWSDVDDYDSYDDSYSF